MKDHSDGDSTFLNGSLLVVSMVKFEEELGLDNFEGSSERRFEVVSILAYWSKRLRFNLEEI